MSFVLAASTFLNVSPNAWAAIGTWALVLVGVIAAVVAGLAAKGAYGAAKEQLVEAQRARLQRAETAERISREQAEAAQRLREEEAQPYVAVFIDLTGTGIHQYDLVVKNFGATAATDVRVKITPTPRSANLRKSNAENWLKVPEVIPVLVPGQAWTTYWDWSGALDEVKDLPRIYEAEVSFSDSRGKRVGPYRFVLDWDTLIDRGSATRYGIHHVADALQDISTAIRSVTSGGTSIPVQNFDGERQRRNATRDDRRRQRRYRVAGNSGDRPSALDRILVKTEKASKRLLGRLRRY
jgi:hypothetical protein